MSPTSSLLLIECVIPTRNKPQFGKYLDLDMLIFAGARNAPSASSPTCCNNGLTLRRVIPTVAQVSIVEAVPT
ncbi:MAG: hypothetical protein QOK33_4985 [Mycobacterium sp.]|nr:hypothetical protein [Mycobacterium sp.]